MTPITSREELIYLLSRACELEHDLSCLYLFAAYSLKSDAGEGGLSADEATMTRTWKRRIAAVGVEEMLHLAQACNLLAAVGGAPHFARRNFPLPAAAFPIGIKLSLEPFSQDTIDRLVCYEMPEPGILDPGQQAAFSALRERIGEKVVAAEKPITGFEPFDVDFATVAELYHKIDAAFDSMPEEELFIGPREAQANARYLDFDRKLVSVFDRASAHAAIKMIIEQGEAPPSAHPDAHFWVFNSIRLAYAEATRRARAEAARSRRCVRW